MPQLKKPLTFSCYGFCCGQMISHFSEQWFYGHSTSFIPPCNSKLYMAGFENTENCKTMYEELCKIMILEYQSDLRKGNHGKQVFLCIFKDK